MTSVEEFRRRIVEQRQLEMQAADIYSGFAAELEEGRYRDLFIAISKEEERHVRACDEILDILQQKGEV